MMDSVLGLGFSTKIRSIESDKTNDKPSKTQLLSADTAHDLIMPKILCDAPQPDMTYITKGNPIWNLFELESAATGRSSDFAEKLISNCIKNAMLSGWDKGLTPQGKIEQLHRLITQTLQASGVFLQQKKTDLLLIGLADNPADRTIDCDTYAYLFSAVAYQLDFPISIMLTKDGEHALLCYRDNDNLIYFDPLTGNQEPKGRYTEPELKELSYPGIFTGQLLANIGNWYYDQGEKHFAQALQYYDQALQNDPENINALINQGNIYASQGRTDLARANYKLSAPNSQEAKDNMAVLTKGGNIDIKSLLMSDPEALSIPTGMAGLPVVGNTINQWQGSYYEMNMGATDSFGRADDPAGYTGGNNGDPDATGILDGSGGRRYVDDQVTDFHTGIDSPDTDQSSPWTMQHGAAPSHFTGGTFRQYFDKNAEGVDQTFTLAYDNAGTYDNTTSVPEFTTRHFSQGSGTINLIPNGAGLQIDCQSLSTVAGAFTTARNYYLGYINGSGDFVVQQVFGNAAAMQTATLTANVMDSTRSWALCYVDQANVGGKNFFIKSKENIDITPFIQQFKASILKKVDLAGNGLISTPIYNNVTKQFEATYTRSNNIPAAPAGVTYQYVLVWNGSEQVLAGFDPNLATSTITLPVNPFTVTNLQLVCRTLVQNVGATGYLNSDGSTAATASAVNLVGTGVEINASTSQTRTLTGTFKNTGVAAGIYQYSLTGATATGLISGMTRIWYANWTGAGAPVVITDPTLPGLFTIPGNPNPTVVANLQIYYEDFSQYDGLGNPTGTPQVSNALALFSSTSNTGIIPKFKGTLKVTVDPANVNVHHYQLLVNTSDMNAYTPFDPATIANRIFYTEVNGVATAIPVATANTIPTNAELDTALAAVNPFSDTIKLYYTDTYLDASTKQSQNISLVKDPVQIINRYNPSLSPLHTGNSDNSWVFAPETDTTTRLPVVAVKFVTTRSMCPYLLDSNGKPITADFKRKDLSDGRYEWTAQFPSGVDISEIRTQDCGSTECTVTYIDGTTQVMELYNNENLELDKEKTAVWGETTIQSDYNKEYVIRLNELSDSQLPVGDKIFERFAFNSKDPQTVRVVYKNHLSYSTISVGFLDTKQAILNKIYENSLVPQKEIGQFHDDRVNEMVNVYILPQFMIYKTDRDALVFKPGLTREELVTGFKKIVAEQLDGLSLDTDIHAEMNKVWDKFEEILTGRNNSFFEQDLEGVSGKHLYLDALLSKYFIHDAEKKTYTLKSGISRTALRDAFNIIMIGFADLVSNLNYACTKLLNLYERYPAAEDAEKLSVSKENQLISFQPNLLTGTGMGGQYLGIGVAR
jgi:hypothetical protein